MDGTSDGYDDGFVRRVDDVEVAASGSSTLDCIVVRYDRRPDRCTLTPRECPDEDRVTTWLSADVGAFVELDEMR